jgi:hypothetical protein
MPVGRHRKRVAEANHSSGGRDRRPSAISSVIRCTSLAHRVSTCAWTNGLGRPQVRDREAFQLSTTPTTENAIENKTAPPNA